MQPEERILIDHLLLGTGLRSTELSLLTPNCPAKNLMKGKREMKQ